MSNNLTDQSYWDEEYTYATLASAPRNHPITQLIHQHFTGKSGSVFEVGCFPGSFLYVFGDLGYELHGIDGTPRVAEMPAFIQAQGYALGTISQGDFFTEQPKKSHYDVVCSFGFIEHFNDFESVIAQHIEYAAPQGSLMITTPNFAGWYQRLAHTLTDSDNLKRHNLESMQPERWRAVCEKAGLIVVTAGYAGKFDFWVEPAQRSLWQKILFYVFAALGKLLKRLIFFDSKAFSPFCVLIAKKP